MVEGGFPHSEIFGSKLIRSSPKLIAAYHVLHRLSAPRHPPNALLALNRSHDRCPRASRRSNLISLQDQVPESCDPGTVSGSTRSENVLADISGRYRRIAASAGSAADVGSKPDMSLFTMLGNSEPRAFETPGAAASSLNGRIDLRDNPLVEPVGIEPTTSSLQS